MNSTKEIKVPKKILDQVIGQDEAVKIIKKAAQQRRHVLLIGEPGTGKSLLGLALAELLPKENLQDIISLPNPNDENTPLIKTAKAGQGREEVRKSQLQAKQFFKNQNFLFFILAVAAMVAPWWIRYQYQSDLMFTAFFLGGMLFLVGIVFMLNLGPRMLTNQKLQYPKLIVDNFDKKQSPFYDGTGAHAGALLGDCLHDPLQCLSSNNKINIIDDKSYIEEVTAKELIDSRFINHAKNIIKKKERNYEAIHLPKNELFILGETNGSVSPVEVLSSNRHSHKGEMIKLITSENKELIVTPEHKIAVWKNNKITYKEAKKIKRKNEVVAKTEYLKQRKNETMKLTKQTIKKIERFPYQGNVYNLTTESGNIFVNNILCKNSGGLGTPANLRIVAGLIHKANKGVLFIDEIATLHPRTQQELLSALQEKQFPITGQSERSSGAMVRTEPVPCLVPDTLIKINGKDIKIGKYIEKNLLKNQGLKINGNQEIIASFANNDKTISFNKIFQEDIPLLVYKTKYQGELIEIKLEEGTVLQTTPDHPIITKQGMIKAGELEIGDSVVINADKKQTVIGEVDIVNTYSREQRRIAYAYLAYCKLSKSMYKNDLAKLLSVDESTIRNWRKGAKPQAIKALETLVAWGLCPLTITDKRLRTLARIAGVLFGDGGIVRNRLYFCTGLEAQKDIADFIGDVKKIFGSSIKGKITVRNTGKGFDISINDAHIVRLFAALGVPKNDKVVQPFSVPGWIYNKPVLEKEFFSSLISSELYGNIKKIGDRPSFVMSKVVKFETNHILFLKEIQKYLNKNKVRTTTIKKSREYDKKTIGGKCEKAAGYSFNLATTHKDLLNFLRHVDIIYAHHKKQALQKVAERSKEYLKNEKRLKTAYQRITQLRKEKKTIRNIAKKLGLAKNTVWKKVEPTYKKYSPEFKKKILEKVTQGEKVKSIASAQDIPIPTIRYWLKNENK